MVRDTLRTVHLRPYRPGYGPWWRLETWDTGRKDWRGQTIIGYRLEQRGDAPGVIFEGEDFAGSPLNASDSDATLAALLGFLTLRPGDTDPEYFANYTDAQRTFAENHAETLAYYVMVRFGEEA